MDRDRLAASDLVGRYLAELGARLRLPAAEAELVLAEAEDHLCETVAAGREIGLTDRAAQEAALSSFGPVQAVVRAHHARRSWLAAAAEAGLAAWKLAAILLLTSGVTGLSIDTIFRIWPPVTTLTPGSLTPCWPCLPIRTAVVVNPVWQAWTATAVGGAILLAGCALALRVRRRRGRVMLLGGFFPMAAAGLFGAIALALTTLNADGMGVPVPGFPSGPSPGLAVPVYPAIAVYLAVSVYLAVAAGYGIRMARTLRSARMSPGYGARPA